MRAKILAIDPDIIIQLFNNKNHRITLPTLNLPEGTIVNHCFVDPYGQGIQLVLINDQWDDIPIDQMLPRFSETQIIRKFEYCSRCDHYFDTSKPHICFPKIDSLKKNLSEGIKRDIIHQGNCPTCNSVIIITKSNLELEAFYCLHCKEKLDYLPGLCQIVRKL